MNDIQEEQTKVYTDLTSADMRFEVEIADVKTEEPPVHLYLHPVNGKMECGQINFRGTVWTQDPQKITCPACLLIATSLLAARNKRI